MIRSLPFSFVAGAAFVLAGVVGVNESHAQSKKVSTPPPIQEKKSSDALDISGLEQQYWAPKDTDFSVVQNRIFKKEKRWAATAIAGPISNDKFASGFGLNLAGTYYLSEKSGVEFSYISVSLQDSPAVNGFIKDHTTTPDHNWFHNYLGVAYMWVPLYGKVSLLDEKILYFDLAVSAGGGMATYATKLPIGDRYVSTGALDLNITQTFFLNNNYAIRFDIRNLWFYENIHQYNDTSVVKTYPFKRSALNNTTFFMLGVTYYH